MRKSTLRLYLPFLALIAAQALLVAFLPSQGAKNGQKVSAAGLLGKPGPAVPAAESDAYTDMAMHFIEKHYEMYNRKFDIIHFQGNCPTTPPDYDTCNAEAKKVIDLYHPFAIVWGTPLYGS